MGLTGSMLGGAAGGAVIGGAMGGYSKIVVPMDVIAELTAAMEESSPSSSEAAASRCSDCSPYDILAGSGLGAGWGLTGGAAGYAAVQGIRGLQK